MMADPREKYDGGGAIVLENPDDPVPQPKIVTADGSILTPEEADALLEIEAEEEDDLSDLDDPLPEES
jgi:hypothetical protein